MKNPHNASFIVGFDICERELIPLVNSSEPRIKFCISCEMQMLLKNGRRESIKVEKKITHAHIISIACAECEMAPTRIFENGFLETVSLWQTEGKISEAKLTVEFFFFIISLLMI